MGTVLTGRVVRFDEVRGYGFIAPDDGGADVFVHANMLNDDKWALAPGVAVEFEATEAERGPKALMVRVIHQQPAASASPAAAVPTVGAAAPAAVAGRVPAGGSADDDDGLCDVLSERALFGEITESLLTSLPDLTAAQVVAVRREVLALARRHGWVED